MSANRFLMFLAAVAAGWLVLDFAGKRPESVEPPRTLPSGVGMLLDMPQADQHLRLHGSMSARLARVAQWARRVPLSEASSILTTVRAMPAGTMRDVAHFILTERWAEQDPFMALWHSRELDMEIETTRRLTLAMPLKRLVELLKREPWLEEELVEALASVDAEKAFQLVQQSGVMSPHACEDIVSGLVDQEGFERAAEIADAFPVKRAFTARNQLVALWAEADAAAALAWVSKQEGNFLLLRAWGREASQSDPDKAMALTAGLDSVSTRAAVSFQGAWALATTDPKAAFIRLADFKRSDSSSLKMAQSLAREVAEMAPEQALYLLDDYAIRQGYEHTPAYTEARRRTYRNVLRSWASREPEAAREFAESLTDAVLRQAAFEGVDTAPR